ncbi:hypothetical protein VTK73DRAFT_8835 [Phialemonium thermophilum]|uniref:Ribonucleases P/MRP subunit Pop8-like domain-containing protein n=1 Tax=Phialemonium thermophilum TaxID=223376 RepID=A0ABR3XM83_9PEZI
MSLPEDEDVQIFDSNNSALADTIPASIVTTVKTKAKKSRELFTCAIKCPPISYVHLQMVAHDNIPTAVPLDALQIRSYCTAALRQFLGDTGVAIVVDILHVSGSECWVRVPRPDLAAFAAALTAFPGVSSTPSDPSQGPQLVVLRIRACGDWLGALLGKANEQTLWSS